VYGGCLGTRRRWRTWLPAISLGESEIDFDPGMSEWGNSIILCWTHRQRRQYPANWNILVAGGKESECDSLSSGERNGNSPNHLLASGVVGPLKKEQSLRIV